MGSIWTRPLTRLQHWAIVVVFLVFVFLLLMPPVCTPRDQARRAAYLSNCKQIALAVQMYEQDWDGAYPRQGPALGNDVSNFARPGARTNWIVAVLPYTKSEHIFVCPSASPSVTRTESSGPASAQPKVCSYLMNGCFNGLHKGKIDRLTRAHFAVGPYASKTVPARP